MVRPLTVAKSTAIIWAPSFAYPFAQWANLFPEGELVEGKGRVQTWPAKSGCQRRRSSESSRTNSIGAKQASATDANQAESHSPFLELISSPISLSSPCPIDKNGATTQIA